MKTIGALLIWGIVLAATAEDRILIVRHGTNVTQRPSDVLATNVVKLLKSCLRPNYFPANAETWNEFEHSDSFILLSFAAPSPVQLALFDLNHSEPEKFKLKPLGEKSIDQILVPLPDQKTGSGFLLNIYAKSGTNILSFSKWSPDALGRVASEPALQMPSHYLWLTNIQTSK